MTHTCVICNRPLKREKSVRQGMGDICYARMRARSTDETLNDGSLDIELYPLDEGVYLKRTNEGTLTNVPHICERHSPDGFEWGYGGSGPADLALNIVEYYCRVLQQQGKLKLGREHKLPKGTAHELTILIYQDFKSTFVANAPEAGGFLPAPVIVEWIQQQQSRRVLFEEV